MKFRTSLAVGACAAFGTYGFIFTSEPPHSAVAVPAGAVFTAVLIACLVLSAGGRRSASRREAEHGRRLAQSRAENERGIAAAEESRRGREARIGAIYTAHQDIHRGYRDPRANFGDYQRLHRAQSAAKRGASRSEVAEAYSRCHPVRGLGNGLRCQL
jgi:hypothetical protein